MVRRGGGPCGFCSSCTQTSSRTRWRANFGTHRTFKARFWPWLEPFFGSKSLEFSKLVPPRSVEDRRGTQGEGGPPPYRMEWSLRWWGPCGGGADHAVSARAARKRLLARLPRQVPDPHGAVLRGCHHIPSLRDSLRSDIGQLKLDIRQSRPDIRQSKPYVRQSIPDRIICIHPGPHVFRARSQIRTQQSSAEATISPLCVGHPCW